MANKYQPKQIVNYQGILWREKHFLEKNYDFLEYEFRNGILYCYGEFQPTPYSENYKYRLKYNPKTIPQVTVRYPYIEYNDDIHMYSDDNSLCLYHKSDLIWNINYHLYNTIIPWTHEWFVFYELYKISGAWEHPFIPHKREEKKIIK